MDPLETPGIDTEVSWRVHWRRICSLRWPEIRQLLTRTVFNWYEHNIPRLGASVAFYTLLSLAPLLVIIVAVAGVAFGREAAQGQLVWQIQDLIGREGAETVQAMLQGAQTPGAGLAATILGGLALIYGATTVVAELRAALNTIWCVPKKEETGLQGLVSVLKERTLALATVVGIGFLLLVSLTVNAALAALGERYQNWMPSTQFLLHSMDFVISYVVITFLFALIYKLLPDLHLEWRDVIPGALVTALLFSGGKVLIGMYLGKAGVGSTYGAAGSLVILLFWVYYSAQIFFLGAEFTQAYAQTFGSHPCDRIGKEVRLATRIEEPAEPAKPERPAPEEALIHMP